MSVTRRVLAPLLLCLLSACDPVAPDAPALTPTLNLRCEHVDAWFEGIYPCKAGTCAFPADRPHRPSALFTAIAAADWDGPSGAAAQTACADVCVGTAESGFYYSCPDLGWRVEATPTLAPAAADLPPAVADLLDPDLCFPDSLCAATFAAPVGASLRGDTRPDARPEHLGVLARPSALTLTTAGVDTPHPLHGRAGYSAGTCDAARCPFLLADLQIDDAGADGPLGLHDLRLDLMQAALGVHTPATGALEFPPGTLDLRIRLTAASGPRELRLRNPVPVRGRFLAGALELAADIPLGHPGHARLDLEFTATAHPPVADFDPPARLRTGPGGLVLPQDPAAASDLHGAHDPDDDLAALHWVVDGLPGARKLPPGEHEVALWVADRRGALARSPLRTITIDATPRRTP